MDNLMKQIINNIILRKKIFQDIRDIHIQLKLKRYNYFNLCNNKDHLLIKYNYYDLFRRFIVKINQINGFINENYLVQIYKVAAQFGRIRILNYFINKCKLDIERHEARWIVDSAVSANRLDVLKYMEKQSKKQRIQVDLEEVFGQSIDKAAFNNNLEMIRWLYDRTLLSNKRLSVHHHQSFIYSSALGHLEVLKWLFQNKKAGEDLECAVSASAREAFNNGNLEILQWLHQENLIKKDYQFALLVNKERCIHTIKWAKEHYQTLDLPCAMTEVAKLSVELVQWFHVNSPNCFSLNTMDIAATYGKLDIVQWLHENRTEGCTVNAMDYSAECNSLEILKWLHLNRTEGCSIRALVGAVEKGNTEGVKWLLENRPSGSGSFHLKIEPMRTVAAINGHLELFKYLDEVCSHPMNYQLDVICDQIIGNAPNLELVKFFHAKNIKLSYEAMTLAVSNSLKRNAYCDTDSEEFEIVKWLIENRTEGCSSKVIECAQLHGNLELIQYFLANKIVVNYDINELMRNAKNHYQYHIVEWLSINYESELRDLKKIKL